MAPLTRRPDGRSGIRARSPGAGAGDEHQLGLHREKQGGIRTRLDDDSEMSANGLNARDGPRDPTTGRNQTHRIEGGGYFPDIGVNGALSSTVHSHIWYCKIYVYVHYIGIDSRLAHPVLK